MASARRDMALVLDALAFAVRRHHGRRREDADGLPAVWHPIDVARRLARAGDAAPALLAAAILHDVVEDTATGPEEIAARFGPAVRDLVAELTDPAGLATAARRARQLRRAPALSAGARLIRLADKASNLESLPADWSRADAEAYLAFAVELGRALERGDDKVRTLLAPSLARARARLAAPAPRPVAIPEPSRTAASARPAHPRALAGRLQRELGLLEEIAGDLVVALSRRTGPRPAAIAPAAPVRGLPADAGTRRGRRRARRYPDADLAALARPGVGRCTIARRSARVWTVDIEGGTPFTTGPVLAALLKVLVGGAAGPDGLPPFQSLAALAGALTAACARPYGAHHVTVYLGRLRESIRDRGQGNPMWIETCPRRGARFRLRRPAA